MSSKLFLSMTRSELASKGISRPDVILVTGDAYIDSPYSGIAIIGRVLESAGYSVAVIAQPDISRPEDIAVLGEPRLFWGVSSGCVDSEIANYTALGKPRRTCDFTPGGMNSKRPDRACIVYANLIRRHFKNTVPVVLGGIEASLRRIAHYDRRTDRFRRSILPDSKADILVYGMGEFSVLEIAQRLRQGMGLDHIPGTCIMSSSAPDKYVRLPDYAQAADNPRLFTSMFELFYRNSQGPAGKGLVQKYESRYLIHHPPNRLPGRNELDGFHELPFTNEVHPQCASQGKVRAMETIQNSITTHRGCYGECSFCSIAVHQGRSVVSRSLDSIVREARRLAANPGFSGVIRDAGGPTANMYGSGCKRLSLGNPCQDRHCTGYNGVCEKLVQGHGKQKRLLDKLKAVPGVNKVQIASGIRFDLILSDQRHGMGYLKQVIGNHTAGQMKIAPEHCSDHVLQMMNKPGSSLLKEFAGLYRRVAAELKKNVYLSCYAIAAHPGCRIEDMRSFLRFSRSNLRFSPEQVQIFTPGPSTRSTAMYCTGIDPFTGLKIWSEKSIKGKQQQKDIMHHRPSEKAGIAKSGHKRSDRKVHTAKDHQVNRKKRSKGHN